MQPKPNLIYRLREDGDEIVLLFGASEITFPAFVRKALEAVLEHGPIVVRDVPDLDDDGKLVLARRLMKEGLLARVPYSY